MDLVNRTIELLENNKQDRARRSHHSKSSSWNESNAGIKEALIKALELDMDREKRIIANPRSRREAISPKDKMKDILNEFIEARDSLNKEYDWKYYNASELWPERKVFRYDWNDTIFEDNPDITQLPADDSSIQNSCSKEIGITSTCFGALILLIVFLFKRAK